VYTVKRTQLYLASNPLREKYLGDAAKRKEALLSAIGLGKDSDDLPVSHKYVRSLRKGDSLKRLSK
jgi:hypothetical protein